MGDLSNQISADDYPDHLNPFDENYNGIQVSERPKGKQKYNTWGANRGNQVVVKQKEKHSFLEKPWAVLNISPRNKVVRRLSFLKTAVTKLSMKKRDHSASFSENSSARSHSLHGDYSFKIVSPKQKEKLRQQAFPALARQEPTTADSAEASNSNHINGRLTPTERLEELEQYSTPSKEPTDSLQTPEIKSRELRGLGDRCTSMRRSRKKSRPPPPPPPVPPPRSIKPADLALCNGGTNTDDDAHSADSSITQDLEKSFPSCDESSLAEFEFDRHKLDRQENDITNIK